MKEVVIKTERIDFCTLKIPNCRLVGYNVVSLSEKKTYRTDLLGYYDSYDPSLEVQKSSPEFLTEQEAINYAEKEWVIQQNLVKTQNIDNCKFERPYANDGWYYQIIFLKNKAAYRADLFGPDYDDYDWHSNATEVQFSSPEFATVEQAEEYVQKEWLIMG